MVEALDFFLLLTHVVQFGLLQLLFTFDSESLSSAPVLVRNLIAHVLQLALVNLVLTSHAHLQFALLGLLLEFDLITFALLMLYFLQNCHAPLQLINKFVRLVHLLLRELVDLVLVQKLTDLQDRFLPRTMSNIVNLSLYFSRSDRSKSMRRWNVGILRTMVG